MKNDVAHYSSGKAKLSNVKERLQSKFPPSGKGEKKKSGRDWTYKSIFYMPLNQNSIMFYKCFMT